MPRKLTPDLPLFGVVVTLVCVGVVMVYSASAIVAADRFHDPFFFLKKQAIYAAIGLWLGLRYILAGAFMAAATLGAYFFLREYFFFWMALVGGGSLILTGFWLRRA